MMSRKNRKRNNNNSKIPAEKVLKDFEKINEKDKEKVTFSFDFLDRFHDLFNMGDNKNNPLEVEKGWFLDLLDCLNDVSKLTRIEFGENKKYDLHPVNWKNANVNCQKGMEQYEWWQFRINKSKGRIIGIFIENCFHIVWLDRYHNLTDSEGYGGIDYYSVPMSMAEQKEIELERAYDRIKELEEKNSIYEELFNSINQEDIR